MHKARKPITATLARILGRPRATTRKASRKPTRKSTRKPTRKSKSTKSSKGFLQSRRIRTASKAPTVVMSGINTMSSSYASSNKNTMVQTINHHRFGPGVRIRTTVPLGAGVWSSWTGATTGAIGLIPSRIIGVATNTYILLHPAYFATILNTMPVTWSAFDRFWFDRVTITYNGLCPSTTPGGGIMGFLEDPNDIWTNVYQGGSSNYANVAGMQVIPNCLFPFVQPRVSCTFKGKPDDARYISVSTGNPNSLSDAEIRQNFQAAFFAMAMQGGSAPAGYGNWWTADIDLTLAGYVGSNTGIDPALALHSAIRPSRTRPLLEPIHPTPTLPDASTLRPPTPTHTSYPSIDTPTEYESLHTPLLPSSTSAAAAVSQLTQSNISRWLPFP
jgi:hypothetical protein